MCSSKHQRRLIGSCHHRVLLSGRPASKRCLCLPRWRRPATAADGDGKTGSWSFVSANNCQIVMICGPANNCQMVMICCWANNCQIWNTQRLLANCSDMSLVFVFWQAHHHWWFISTQLKSNCVQSRTRLYKCINVYNVYKCTAVEFDTWPYLPPT